MFWPLHKSHNVFFIRYPVCAGQTGQHVVLISTNWKSTKRRDNVIPETLGIAMVHLNRFNSTRKRLYGPNLQSEWVKSMEKNQMNRIYIYIYIHKLRFTALWMSQEIQMKYSKNKCIIKVTEIKEKTFTNINIWVHV